MKTAFTFIAVLSLTLSGTTFAGEKTYRAVGTMLRGTDTMLLMRTSAQDIEITRDAKTKVNGTLTKGALLTVTYIKKSGAPYATEINVSASDGRPQHK